VNVYRRGVAFFGVVFVVLGLGLVARTAAAGGGGVGYLLGLLFVGLGAGRLYLLRRR
jgi:hypothetical protein